MDETLSFIEFIEQGGKDSQDEYERERGGVFRHPPAPPQRCAHVSAGAQQAAEKLCWLVWFIWSIWLVWSVSSIWFIELVWFNQTDETDRTDQTDETDETDETDQITGAIYF
jgi:hypothetical protein